MNNQLETINKFLECYKAEVNNHSTDGEYNKYSFRLVTANEWSYNSRTEALSKDVESRFQGIYNSFEYEPFDEVRGCTDCLITLGLECFEMPKIEWSKPYFKDDDITYKIKISHKDPVEVEKAKNAIETIIKLFKENKENDKT